MILMGLNTWRSIIRPMSSFILVHGKAILITAEKKENGFSIDLTLMEQGKVYNVPAECWFYSITQKDTKIVYVQDSNCSMENSDFCDLSEEEIAWIQEKHHGCWHN